MDYLVLLISNKLFMAAVISWAAAQVLKTLINLIVNKTFDPGRLVGSGGMPSSHSAFVNLGPDSPIFAVAFVVAFVVMYDAMGVRRETGKQAELLNQITEIFSQNYAEFDTPEKALKVLVGHTPLQVLFGCVIGIIVGVVV